MKRKKDERVIHELKDQPVPPVKGMITDRMEDIVLRPENRRSADLEDTIIFDGWM